LDTESKQRIGSCQKIIWNMDNIENIPIEKDNYLYKLNKMKEPEFFLTPVLWKVVLTL
jgi:hypothetical protein